MNRRKMWIGLGLVAIVGAVVLLVAGGLRENVVYFLTPTELEAKGAEVYGAPLRLGGQVKPESVDWNAESGRLLFVITDGETELPVESSGAPPAMFSEGMGVVVEGSYREDGVFRSHNVMVKHSNEYRPPEEGEHPKEIYRSLVDDEAGR
ncbi:MAG: cytochrome c maturation protein CcmE [Gemmatimonadota bacterium]|jgi:cytochrome c-type biogenesis protein CcmE|nr:MAG: cytochrome c maturation protein CcmE [Gemmatimonadota bacterium]